MSGTRRKLLLSKTGEKIGEKFSLSNLTLSYSVATLFLLRTICFQSKPFVFTHSPSTLPILTSEFFIANLRMLSQFEGYESAWWLPLWLPLLLRRLHWNKLRWDVGECIQVFYSIEIGWFLLVMIWLEIDRLGEIDQLSIKNLMPKD